ncbi:8-oxo-dGTP pyrophosphatase MutT (NUDIX family) [Actinoplanes tereljensis]|uniref:NUDIX hydrolase n=1 Tax=Paractinoplanes tereljensis TaxID=571912 RepID=A0A919TQM6_9ACTN|nr:NUDIX hydrolase [Actinoplanes tereljensis]GIF19323.1 NUDIX hydrolase [Actinoplanes tereljensis]
MSLLVAAGALFRDADGRIMMVRTHYKDEWEIPGGMVEEGETPSEACTREVREELGLVVSPGQALIIDWAPHPTEGDKLLFLFDGGILTEAQHAAIEFTDGEILEWAYIPVAHLAEYTVDRLARRIRAAVPGETRYLENGRLAGSA